MFELVLRSTPCLTVLPLAVGGDREAHSVHGGEVLSGHSPSSRLVVLVFPDVLRAGRVPAAHDGDQRPRLSGRRRETERRGSSVQTGQRRVPQPHRRKSDQDLSLKVQIQSLDDEINDIELINTLIR